MLTHDLPTHDPRFIPPFCPWPECKFHQAPTGFRFRTNGVYGRQCQPRVIRRFKCLHCGRGFSTQTFDTTYYLKRPDLQRPLMEALTACSGFRQHARIQRVAPSTLQRQASRLGRHCLLFEQSRRPTGRPDEPLVLDGFMTFEYSQYWPFELNLLVGKKSHYVYGMTESPLRRSGRMTERQRKEREQLEREHGRPDPQATRKAVEALVRNAVPAPAALSIYSDEHQAYPRAFRRLPHAIEHSTVSSRRCRTANNPLFVVDLLDLLIRHGSANHKRETIAFSKRRQGALERAAVLQVWRNHIKRVSENRSDSPTPAQAIGLATGVLRSENVLMRRLFRSRIALPAPLDAWYRRDVATRQIANGTTHRLKNAA